MNLTTIIISTSVLGALGLIFGAGLAFASKTFAVHVDPRTEKVEELLPGANCGACGRPGCSGTAEAMVKGECDLEACPVATREAVTDIAQLLGMTVAEREPTHAVVLCRGGYHAIQRQIYAGVSDCRAAFLVHGGDKACEFGCLGFGTCVDACPFDAIHMGPEGVPVVNDLKCVSCGKCETACPKGIIAVLPKAKAVQVLCSSKDKGGAVRKFCEAGCIGCKKCEKACESDAIKVIDFLARIDLEKCTVCGACVEACPRDAIADLRKGIPTAKPKKEPAATG